MRVDAITQQRMGTVLFYGIVILLAYFAFQIFAPFLVALAWAAVLVVVAHPVYKRLEPRWGPALTALACTVGVTLVIIVPVLAAMYAFVQQGIGAVHAIQAGAASGHFEWMNRLWRNAQARFPEVGPEDLGSTLRRYVETAAGFAAGKLGTIVSHLFTFFFHLFVTILAMFYLFRDGAFFVARLQRVLPFEQETANRMLKEAQELIFASVVSSAAGAAANGLLGGIVFAAAGLGEPVFWGVMMAFFSLVPLVGSALIWVPAAVSLVVAGHLTRGILLIAFCIVIVSCVDNILRPWLISGRAEMGGLMVFISVLGGVSAFGMLGVVLGPMIVAAVTSLLDLYAPEARGGNKKFKANGKQLRGVLE